jgi:hypothetical protein
LKNRGWYELGVYQFLKMLAKWWLNDIIVGKSIKNKHFTYKFKVTIKLYLLFILFTTSQRCGFFYKNLNKSTCKTFEQLRASIVSIRQFFPS